METKSKSAQLSSSTSEAVVVYLQFRHFPIQVREAQEVNLVKVWILDSSNQTIRDYSGMRHLWTQHNSSNRVGQVQLDQATNRWDRWDRWGLLK